MEFLIIFNFSDLVGVLFFSLLVSVRVSAIFCRTLSVGCIELHIFCVLNLYRPIGFLSFFSAYLFTGHLFPSF